MNNLLTSLNTLSKTITNGKTSSTDTTVASTSGTIEDGDDDEIGSRLLLDDIRNENSVLRKENFRLMKQLDLLKGISQEVDHLQVLTSLMYKFLTSSCLLSSIHPQRSTICTSKQ